MTIIDLRSDTVTKPSAAMRDAMAKADVGDDVFGEDPTVNRLQDRVARLFGKEASLFVPSGTMGNEISIKAQTQPGDEIIVDQDSHIFVYETGAPSLLSGVQMRALQSDRGVLTATQVKQAIRPNAYYIPPTRLICLENTHGRSGGRIFPIDEVRAIWEVAAEEKIKVHLDGARLWNASIASGIGLSEYAKYVDSICVCFSKGLGAPIGSIIIGDHEFIDRARKYRKVFGGGMRQVGILAAAALYALDHNVDRLREDHTKAMAFANGISQLPNFHVELEDVQTNMVIADLIPKTLSPSATLNTLKSKGVLLTPERDSAIRAVTHMDVSIKDVEKAAAIVRATFG